MNILYKLLEPNSSSLIGNDVTDEKLLRWICQRDFLCFCMAVDPEYMPTRFHSYIARKLQKAYEDVKTGRDVRTLLACPPQHGKSRLFSQLMPAWILGKERWPVIQASYSADLAERNSQACRDIVESDVFKLIFPTVRLNTDSTSKSFWQTNIGGSYRAVGVLGGLTGFSGKWMVFDDLIASQADADSQVISESTWAWFKTVFYTRKQSKSGIVGIATRWSLNDPTGRLLEQQDQYRNLGLPEGQYDVWDYMSFPAIAERNEFLPDGWSRKAGEVICPERFTLDDMIKTKNSLISEGKVSEWVSLYQQEPILTENAEFKAEFFRFYEENQIKDLELDSYTLVDLAISQKKTADYTVVLTVSKDRNGPNWYVREYTSGRFDPLQTINAIFDHTKRYGSSVNIEAVAYQASLQTFVLEEQRRRQAKDDSFRPFTVNDIKHGTVTKKEERIRGLIPYFRNGTLLMKKHMAELQKELLQFPKGKHDDHIDALSFFLSLKRLTVFVQPEVKKEDMSYTAMWRKRQGLMQENGFNPHASFNSVT